MTEWSRFWNPAGINVLLDDVIQIADGKINLVGRLDEEKPGDGTKNRKPLDELLSECDMNKPVIVINHEPTSSVKMHSQVLMCFLAGTLMRGSFSSYGCSAVCLGELLRSKKD